MAHIRTNRPASPSRPSMTIATFTAVARALADSHRVRMLMALRVGELCACQLITLVGLAPSTVSKHMAVLKQAGLVAGRKDGRWMYYRLPEKWGDDAAGRMAASFLDGLKQDDTVRADRRQLNAICSVDRTALCKARRRAAGAGRQL